MRLVYSPQRLAELIRKDFSQKTLSEQVRTILDGGAYVELMTKGILKSRNDWESQPRDGDGQFGEKKQALPHFLQPSRMAGEPRQHRAYITIIFLFWTIRKKFLT